MTDTVNLRIVRRRSCGYDDQPAVAELRFPWPDGTTRTANVCEIHLRDCAGQDAVEVLPLEAAQP